MKHSSLNLPAAITVLLSLLLTPLSGMGSGSEQDKKVYGEVRPDAALVYICGAVKDTFFYDDQLFINMSGYHSRCTFTRLFPGTHVLWDRYGRSWLFDFAPGQTYYLGNTYEAGLGFPFRLCVLSEAEGQAKITKAKQFVEPTQKERSKAASAIAKRWPLIKEKLESKIALAGGEVLYVPPASTDSMIKIPMGTVLTVKLMENLNSGLNKAGDNIWFCTTEDVRVDDNLFVRAGTPVKALVRETEKTSRFEESGRLDATIVSVPAADGTVSPLIGQVSAIGLYHLSIANRALTLGAFAAGGLVGSIIVGALTKGVVALVPSGELSKAFTKRDIWIKPVRATAEKNSVTRNSDQVVKAYASREIVFNVGKGEVPEAVQIIFEDSGDIASAELIEVAGDQIPRPIRATSLTRAKEGWIAQYGGWDLCRFLRLGDAGTRLAFRLTATDGTVVIAQGVVSMTLK
jgi:hypothetical protein